MENISKEIIWQKLLEYMEASKDFVLEQTPEVLQQALRYEKTMALLSMLLMTGLLAGYLSFMLYLVFSLDHIFQGPEGIKPEAFEQVLTIFDRWDK